MWRCSWKNTTLTAMLAVFLAGCVGRSCPPQRFVDRSLSCDRAAEYDDSVTEQEVLSTGEIGSRGRLVPDVSELQPSESDLEGQEDLDRYRVLREDEVKCLAAAAAPIAQMADLESQAVLCLSKGRHYATPEATLQSQLLEFRSAEERNRAASNAMEAFFHLAEAEASRDHIWRAIDQIDEMIYFAGRLKATTIGADIDESALFRRKNELLDQQVQLRLTIADLNSKLRQLLGLDVDDPTPIWPDTDLKVVVDDLDIDAAVSNGLAMRPDLAGLELVYSSLSAEALPSARNTLRSADPSLGVAKTPTTLMTKFAAHHAGPELATRIDQLGRLLTERQRSAAEEIRQAALTVNTRLRQVGLANRSLESWKRRLDEYVKSATLSGSNSFDIANAQINLIKAERELLHAVGTWEIARVHLKKAQGLYASECGYTAIDETRYAGDATGEDGEPTEAAGIDDIAPVELPADEPPAVSPLGPEHDEPTPAAEEPPAGAQLQQPRSVSPTTPVEPKAGPEPTEADPLTPAYVEPTPVETPKPSADDRQLELSPTPAPTDRSRRLPPADEMDPFEDVEVVREIAPEILIRQPSSLSRIPRTQVR